MDRGGAVRGRSERVLHVPGIDRQVRKLVPVESPVRPDVAQAHGAPGVDAHSVRVEEDHVAHLLGWSG